MIRWQVLGLALSFVLLGSVAYYTYSATSQLGQQNSNLQQEVEQLQSRISQLKENLSMSQSQQGLNAQQIAAVDSKLQSDENALTDLVSDVGQIKAGNTTAMGQMVYQLQNLSSAIRTLQENFSSRPPIFLRQWGLGLAYYVELPDEMHYLQLVENGVGGGAETALGSQSFNATIAGNSVQWDAVANGLAADKGHTFWPMVLENSPGGTDAIEFEDSGGTQEAAVVLNGVRTYQLISWDPTSIHSFKIVVVTPGAEVDFYIDNARVATITTGIPTVSSLLEGSEVRGDAAATVGVAALDTYGGLLGGT